MSTPKKKAKKTTAKKKVAKPRATKAKVARTRRRKLTGAKAKTSNRRRRMHAVVSEEYDWSTEMPNLKLSRAFVIVLVLHVVVVAGLLCYELIGRKSTEASAAEQSAGGAIEEVYAEAEVEPVRAIPIPQPQAREDVYIPPSVVDPPVVDPPVVDNTARIATTTYTVVQGDTLSAVSRNHSTSVAVLVRLNNLGQARGLQIGEILKVPRR